MILVQCATCLQAGGTLTLSGCSLCASNTVFLGPVMTPTPPTTAEALEALRPLEDLAPKLADLAEQWGGVLPGWFPPASDIRAMGEAVHRLRTELVAAPSSG